MSDEVGVEPERLDQVANALEHLRDVLAANVPVIVNMMNEYWSAGTGAPISLSALLQAQSRSPEDAADMRARSNLAQAWMNNPANIDLVVGGEAYIPWDGPALDSQDASAETQALAAAEADLKTDPKAARAEIQAIQTDLKDHVDSGDETWLRTFYDQGAPQVANLASALYAQNGTLKQPLPPQDQRILNTFASGLAYVTKNGVTLTPQAMDALTNAPDMWSVAMLVKYGPDVAAYGTGPGQQFLQAVNNATVQISPHVIVAANDPDVPALRAAWAWASKNHILLASSPGDAEFTRWVQIVNVSPYTGMFHGQLKLEFSGIDPDFRINGAFNENEKVLLSTGGAGAVVFFNDPRSLLGAKPTDVEKLVPDGFTGPKRLTSGQTGWRYFDSKGRSVMYEEGDPNAPNLGQPDSMLHQGPYYKISENGYVYRISAESNPALNDPNAATISITAPDGTKTYLNEQLPTDDPGDGDGDGGDLSGAEGGGGDAGVAAADG